MIKNLPRTISFLLCITFLGSLTWQWWSDPARIAAAGMEAVSADDLEGIKAAQNKLQENPRYAAYADFFAAVIALREKRMEQALELLQRPLGHPDLEVDARVLAGRVSYSMGIAGNAQVFWEDALARDPYNVAAHRWLGVLYFDLGAMENALLHLKAVSRFDPEDPRPDRLMGLINHDYERPAEAIIHYEETLKRDPNQPEVGRVWLEYAECLFDQRDFEGAMQSALKGEDSARKNRLIAECQLNLGNLAEAKSYVEKALSAEPSDVKSLRVSADILLLDGKVNEAVELLKQAVAADPFSHAARMQYSQVLGRLGDVAGAEAQTRKADELQKLWEEFSNLQIDAINQSTNAEIRVRIAELAQQLGKPELAIVWYRAALAINPSLENAAQALNALSPPAGS